MTAKPTKAGAEIDEAAELYPWPPPPVARWRRILAVPMFLLTVIYGLGAGLVLGATLLAWATGSPFFRLQTGAGDGEDGFHASGWGLGAALGLFLIVLASVQNRIRRRTLNPRRNARASPV